jgi:hypothetical protein
MSAVLDPFEHKEIEVEEEGTKRHLQGTLL